MPEAAGHNLLLVDRGLNHIHRWHPSCSCGWQGPFRRRRKEAVEQYKIHKFFYHRRLDQVRRPVTPIERWPEAWRVDAEQRSDQKTVGSDGS